MTTAQLNAYYFYLTDRDDTGLSPFSVESDSDYLRFAIARGMFFMASPEKMHPHEFLTQYRRSVKK